MTTTIYIPNAPQKTIEAIRGLIHDIAMSEPEWQGIECRLQVDPDCSAPWADGHRDEAAACQLLRRVQDILDNA